MEKWLVGILLFLFTVCYGDTEGYKVGVPSIQREDFVYVTTQGPWLYCYNDKDRKIPSLILPVHRVLWVMRKEKGGS